MCYKKDLTMAKLKEEIYSSGLSFQEFLKIYTKNRDYFLKRYTENLLASFGKRKKEALSIIGKLKAGPKRKVLVITVDWCPDSYNTLGFYVRLSEELEWEIKIFEKERPPRIIQYFKKNGTKEAVPVYAFYSEEGNLLFWVSDRDKAIEPWNGKWLSGRNFSLLSREEKRKYLEDLNRYYDKEFFEITILNTLKRLIVFNT
ncbi:MAG: hypothetical protein GXP33_12535 [Spirochaetes bacterium]|nr:hypothetical protein [Spirochaetota bacterium]